MSHKIARLSLDFRARRSVCGGDRDLADEPYDGYRGSKDPTRVMNVRFGVSPKKNTAKASKARRRPPKRRNFRSSLASSSVPNASPSSKQDRVVAMLRYPEGSTIAAISRVTNWKAHTVRGFFSSVVRRRLGLDLRSERRDGIRIYRIIEP
jgi:hypothetical protein